MYFSNASMADHFQHNNCFKCLNYKHRQKYSHVHKLEGEGCPIWDTIFALHDIIEGLSPEKVEEIIKLFFLPNYICSMLELDAKKLNGDLFDRKEG